MPERDVREFAQRYLDVLNRADFDRLGEFLHPDCVYEFPQSGERFRGIANIRATMENYPGGFDRDARDLESLRVAGGTEAWAMAPNFTLLRTSGTAGSYTTAVKGRYPDGSHWYIVTMFERADRLVTRASLFFAPMFEAPEWRRPFAEATRES